MSRQKYILSFSGLLFVFYSFGQISKSDSLATASTPSLKSKNLLYVQIIGDYFLGGLNYERHYLTTDKFHLSGRLGFGRLDNRFAVFVGTNFLLGKKTFLFELGANPGLLFDKEMNRFIVSANLGIRYQNTSKSPLFLRLSINPLFNAPEETNVIPIAVGLGFGF